MKVLGRVSVKGLSLICNFNLQTQNPTRDLGFRVKIAGVEARNLSSRFWGDGFLGERFPYCGMCCTRTLM